MPDLLNIVFPVAKVSVSVVNTRTGEQVVLFCFSRNWTTARNRL